MTRLFDLLTPQVVVAGIENAYDLVLDGTVQPYPSYTNRVYGLRGESGVEYVAKFYRPGRWSEDAIVDEHRFIQDCAAADVPVVEPIPNVDGDTLSEVESVDQSGTSESFFFALFPKMGGRNFDAEGDEDWFRLGSVVGRCHAAALRGSAPHRVVCTPGGLTSDFVDEILDAGIVHADHVTEFEDVCRGMIDDISPLFTSVRYQRVHGDCHRGNILDRPGTGLLVIDFDDMMTAPAVQDLWLLLPDYADFCRRELTLLTEGYEQFASLDRSTFGLIEPLRFMRIIYFLAWRARQRHDYWFRSAFPEWGTEAFWVKEIEDLRVQSDIVRNGL